MQISWVLMNQNLVYKGKFSKHSMAAAKRIRNCQDSTQDKSFKQEKKHLHSHARVYL